LTTLLADYEKPNHQIILNSHFITQKAAKQTHNNGMAVGV
jgi:hypothetical protein